MIDIKQYRSCNKCKALILNSCILGYPIKGNKEMFGITVSYKPLKKCPKPITNDDMLITSDNYRFV